MRRVLFVCTANICRSPMAAGLFEALANDRGLAVEVHSAGTAALIGQPAARDARRVMEEMGVPIEAHRARQVDEKMIRSSDLVLAMTPKHREALRKSYGGLGVGILTLPEYAEGDAMGGIADPYGYGLGVFRTSAREILRYVEEAVDLQAREEDP